MDGVVVFLNRQRFLLVILSIVMGFIFCFANMTAVAHRNLVPIVTVTVNDSEISLQNAPFMKKGIVYIPIRELSDEIDVQSVWDVKQNKIFLTMPGKRVVISSHMIKNGTAYIPIRLLRESLGLTVTWDAQADVVDIAYISPYLKISDADSTYLLHPVNGDLYVSMSGRGIQSLGKTNIKIRAGMEGVTTGLTTVSSTTKFLLLAEMYGEPHLNDDQYVVVLQQNRMILQTKTHYYGHHPIRNIWKTAAGDYVLLDGKWLYVVNKSGQMVKKHDLEKLTGYKDSAFQVEWYDRDFMIVRPHYTGWLTAVDIKTKKAIRLIDLVATPEQLKVYKEYFPNEQQSVEFRDWDGLKFIGRAGGKIQVTHDWFLDSNSTRLVTLDLPSLFAK